MAEPHMSALFDGGRVVDLILVLMACETALLFFLHARGHIGIEPRRLLPNMLAGAFLLLALRAALVGAGTPTIAAWLALGLCGHLADLAARWRRKPASA
jgi:hypothetical protein